jgi:hypothetical protein
LLFLKTLGAAQRFGGASRISKFILALLHTCFSGGQGLSKKELLAQPNAHERAANMPGDTRRNGHLTLC